MKNEVRTAVYDGTLQVEAYRLQGIAQPFPAHFHDHYVIGLTEAGERRMICRDRPGRSSGAAWSSSVQGSFMPAYRQMRSHLTIEA
ncbi:MAG: AraC family ligand binding domain-containing protein [Oscillospiraceae bacterium]